MGSLKASRLGVSLTRRHVVRTVDSATTTFGLILIGCDTDHRGGSTEKTRTSVGRADWAQSSEAKVTKDLGPYPNSRAPA